MAMQMDRRTFLKTSASAAVAVAMTGLLGGCGETPAPIASVTLPGFVVSLLRVSVKGGVVYDDTKNETLSVDAAFSLTYTGTGFSSDAFGNIFSASILDTPLDLRSSGLLTVSDFPLNKAKTCTVSFYKEAEGLNTAYANGTPVVLKVKLSNQIAQFTCSRNGEVTGTFVSSV